MNSDTVNKKYFFLHMSQTAVARLREVVRARLAVQQENANLRRAIQVMEREIPLQKQEMVKSVADSEIAACKCIVCGRVLPSHTTNADSNDVEVAGKDGVDLGENEWPQKCLVDCSLKPHEEICLLEE